MKAMISMLGRIVSLYCKPWQSTYDKFLVGLMVSQSALWVLMWPQELQVDSEVFMSGPKRFNWARWLNWIIIT